jgi:tetratricopeptide (TPR) repeat protein
VNPRASARTRTRARELCRYGKKLSFRISRFNVGSQGTRNNHGQSRSAALLPPDSIFIRGAGRNPAEEISLIKPTAVAAAVLLAGTAFFTASPVAAQQPAQAAQSTDPTKLKTHGPKVSKEALKQISALQTAVDGKDPAAIATALSVAQAAAKTPEDRYFIGLLQIRAAAAAKDSAGIAAGLEAVLASGAAAPDEQFSVYYNLAETYGALKQYDRAATAYQKATELNPTNVDAIAGLADTRAAQGQAADAVASIQHGIKLYQASGQKAPESWYKRATAVAYKGKLPQLLDISRAWVEAYPSQSSWHDALLLLEQGSQLDKQQRLDLLRLKRAAGSLTDADYFEYANLALQRGLAGEGQAVLDEGLAAKTIDRANKSISELYDVVAEKTKGDKESLPASPAALADAQRALVNGDAWYGYGDFAKAAEFDQAALTKPGADANLINLHLGMALAQQGDKSAAEAAFSKVGGASQELARFWLTYLSTKA